MTSPRVGRHADRLAAAALALIVVLPLLAPGFVLTYDMVFVPRQEVSAELLGISRTLPRSVPSGLLVALASTVLSGQVVQKLILVAIFGGAALGAARLTPSGHPAARIAAAVLYAWNPFTYQRLLLGHWALLLGYAALPWVARAALSLRRGEPGAGWRLVLVLAAATAASPYTGILAVAAAGAAALWPPGWSGVRAAALLGAGVAVNLPWLVPALLSPDVPERPALAMRLFGARSDSPLGTIGSLLSLGGLWRTDLAPPGRSAGLWIPAFVLLLAMAAAGYPRLRARWPRGAGAGLLALAALGLLLAAGPRLPVLRSLDLWLAGNLPGGGILRESQKFVVPLALLLALSFGLGVERVVAWAGEAGLRTRSAAVLLPLLPVALAPTLAWGASGRLAPAPYPESWARAERAMAADPAPGAVLLLPWHTFLPFGWNDGRTVHEPASDYFRRPVLASSSLELGPYELPHEDPWSRLADPVVEGPGALTPDLRALGVRYVLLFKEADWRSFHRRITGLQTVLDTPDLALYRGPAPGRIPDFPTPPWGPVVAADLVALGVVGGAALRRAGLFLRGRASCYPQPTARGT